MSEITDKDKVAKKDRKSRPRPTNAVQFTVWATNGSPLPDGAVELLEAAIQNAQMELFNQGYRVLTQTTKS